MTFNGKFLIDPAHPFGLGPACDGQYRPVEPHEYFRSCNALQRQPKFDPTEMVSSAVNSGFCADMGVLVSMLEVSGEPRKTEVRGEIQCSN